jgi:hypothetical protein
MKKIWQGEELSLYKGENGYQFAIDDPEINVESRSIPFDEEKLNDLHWKIGKELIENSHYPGPYKDKKVSSLMGDALMFVNRAFHHLYQTDSQYPITAKVREESMRTISCLLRTLTLSDRECGEIMNDITYKSDKFQREDIEEIPEKDQKSTKDNFKVILQITDRHGIVEKEQSLYTSSCGAPMIPSEGNTILWKGMKYHIHSVIWDYDKSIIYVLCRVSVSRTVRTIGIAPPTL